MTRPKLLRASVPQELHKAVKLAAQDAKMTVSEWLRHVVVRSLTYTTLPKLRERATSEPTKQKMHTLLLISLLRDGITSDTKPGRLKNRHQRAAYMNYCHRCARSGAPRAPFAIWAQTHSAPIAPHQ